MMDAALQSRIAAAGQTEVLRFFSSLTPAGQENLSRQLAAIDWEQLPELTREYVLRRPETKIPADLQPAPYFSAVPDTPERAALYERARAAAAAAMRAGKIAVLTVAGGQGTRLGFDGPKGTYPFAPLSGKTLFQYFAEELLRAGEHYGRAIDWYVMTGVSNDAATRAFFAEHRNFGLAPDQVTFFTQGTMPAFGTDGKLLLSAEDSLALSPDGHGGTLLALLNSGSLARMRQRGTELISYFQIDNPLVPFTDELFLGLHLLEGSEMSAIMLPKTNAVEKVGNFCVSGGKLQVIEYSDLPEDLARSVNPDGSLRFRAGSPAIHVISRSFIERITTGGRLALPWHRADKKIKCLDAAGHRIEPETPNGVKLEMFIFDALPLAQRTLVLEADRKEVFAPVKNATGVDSAESCRAMLMDRDARRLERIGVKVPRKADGTLDCQVELSPRTVRNDADAAACCKRNGLTGLCAGQAYNLE